MTRRYWRAAAAMLALAASAAAIAAPALDEYGGWPEIWGRQTGFFALEKIRDRWWFVTPAGNVFLCKGVEAVASAPGEPPETTRQRLAGWGFNTIGPHIADDLRGGGIAYTLLLNLSRPTIEAGANVGRNFPDVFDPRFERIANEIAANICSLHTEDPWLVGYFSDDALEWRSDGPTDLVDAFFALPAESAGKQALVAEIRRRYGGNVARFNAGWGLSLTSFDDLLAMRQINPGPRFRGYQVSRDRAALLALIARRYFEITSAAIRAADPNHLVLGCRFARPPGPEIAAAMRQRADVLSVACAPTLAPQLVTQLHSDSGLPLLITPLAVTPPASAAGGEAQGAVFEAAVEQLQKEAFVVGYSWPHYADQPVGAPAAPPGLVTAQGQLRDALLARITRANNRFYVQASRARLKPTLFEVATRYELRRAPAVGVSIDGKLNDWAGAMPMELRPSAYESDSAGIEAAAYLMWDAGAVYFAGRLCDPSLEASTVTSYVGADWLELVAAAYPFYVTLQPGNQTVTDREGETKEAHLVVGRILAPQEGGAPDRKGRIVGYTFEGRVNVSALIPQGFVFRFGLALHHYSRGGREVRLAFPYYWSPDNPASGADIIVTGPAGQ